MFEHDFDPYEFLIQTVERQQRLETAHNRLADAYSKSQHDLTVSLHTIQNLQHRYISVLQRLDALEREMMNAQSNRTTNTPL